MMGKILTYLTSVIRVVYLFGINVLDSFLDLFLKPSKFFLRASFVALILLSSFNFESYAQENCETQGFRYCDGGCRPARECRQGVPPPPGLPIDSKLPYLLIAGLGLGIYYLRSKKAA